MLIKIGWNLKSSENITWLNHMRIDPFLSIIYQDIKYVVDKYGMRAGWD